MKRFSTLFKKGGDNEVGINMVDLMMWLVIAALLLAAAIQGIGYYQQNAYVYQMKEAANVAASRIMAMAANDGSVDADDADAIVAEENSSTSSDQITLSVETVPLSASSGTSNYGFDLASVATATTVGAGETFYLRATHEAVSKNDVVYFFKNTANQKEGLHLVGKGQNGTGSDGVTSPPSATTSPTATASPSPTATTEPSPTPTPTPTVSSPPADVNAAGLTITRPSNSAHSWRFDNKNAYAMTSSSSLFGFQIADAAPADYTVEYSGGANINASATMTPVYENNVATNNMPNWYAHINTTSEGWKQGTGYITVKVTHKTSGAVSYKTWTLNVLAQDGPIRSVTHGSRWDDKTVYTLTSDQALYGFQLNGATTSDYTFTYSGGENVNANTAAMTSTYENNSGNPNWYTYVPPTSAGWKAGTGSITLTARHNGTGTVFTKTWTLNVVENPGPIRPAHTNWSGWWDNKSVTAGSTTAPRFGFTIPGGQYAAYDVVFTGGENINASASKPTQTASASGTQNWFVDVAPATGGWTQGTGTITATVTHKATGKVFTKTWTITVP